MMDERRFKAKREQEISKIKSSRKYVYYKRSSSFFLLFCFLFLFFLLFSLVSSVLGMVLKNIGCYNIKVQGDFFFFQGEGLGWNVFLLLSERGVLTTHLCQPISRLGAFLN